MSQSLITKLIVAFEGQQLIKFVEEEHRLQALGHGLLKKNAKLFRESFSTIHDHQRSIHQGKAIADLPRLSLDSLNGGEPRQLPNNLVQTAVQ